MALDSTDLPLIRPPGQQAGKRAMILYGSAEDGPWAALVRPYPTNSLPTLLAYC